MPDGPDWPLLCSICGKRPGTLDVPVMASSGANRRVTRHESWCPPCRDAVFPAGRETAWRHVTEGWLPKSRIPV